MSQTLFYNKIVKTQKVRYRYQMLTITKRKQFLKLVQNMKIRSFELVENYLKKRDYFE